MVGVLASHANERHFAQALLHHPFKIAVEITIDEENIERSLVVGDEHI